MPCMQALPESRVPVGCAAAQGGMAQLQKARKCPDLTWVERFQVGKSC